MSVATPGAIVFKTFGFKRTEHALLTMQKAAFDAIPFWKGEVIPDMERIEHQVFNSQGRRGGGSWKFLSQETIDTKAREGLDPRINIATGAMMLSVTEGSEFGDVPYAVREVTPTGVKFGTTAPGAAQSQQYRVFLRWTHFDTARWARWWTRYVIRAGKEAAAAKGASDV